MAILTVLCLAVSAAVGSPADVTETYALTLSVGQVEGIDSLPSAVLDMLPPGVKLSFAPMPRSEVWPSTTPLPDTINELPDIVSALVGFCDSDLPSLCDSNLIDPIDSLFEELKLDPKEIMPPEMYSAVSYKGKVWALPYRVEVFVLKYQKDAFARVGLTPGFASWQELLAASEKLSTEAYPGTQISGFSPVKMRDELFASFLMSVQMDVPAGSGTFAQLLKGVQERKVIQPDGFNWRDPMHDSGIRYILPRNLVLDSNTDIMCVPEALAPGMPKTIRSLGLMECFAIRKNAENKTAAARSVLKILLSKEAQLALLNATAYNKIQRELTFRHIPVFRHVVESEEFQAQAKKVPAYATLAECCAKARFTSADDKLLVTRRQAVLERAEEARSYIEATGDRVVGVFKLAEPIEVKAADTVQAAPNFANY